MSEEIMNSPEKENDIKETTISSEQETNDTTQSRKPNRIAVTIGSRNYNTLATYCKYTDGNTVSKIVNSLVQEFLEKEEVKSVLEEHKVDKKKQKMIEAKKAKVEKILAEIAALENE